MDDVINFDSLSKTSTAIDAKGADFPVALQRLKTRLNKAKDHTVFAVASTDRSAEPNFREFCRKTGNVFVGVEQFDAHDVYYVKKRTVECQRCNNIRAALMGIVDIGLLIYTVPQMINTKPTLVVMVLFLVALLTLPSAVLHGARSIKKFLKKVNGAHSLSAAE